MRAFRMPVTLSLPLFLLACASAGPRRTADANAGIDSLNARIVNAYRTHDAQAYGTLYTDRAVFEWPAFSTVHGRAGMTEMARGNWASLRDMDLALTVTSRHVDGDHATEFGGFEQSWADSSGARQAEFGRYAVLLARQRDGRWLMEHFFGFEDSTRTLSAKRTSR